MARHRLRRVRAVACGQYRNGSATANPLEARPRGSVAAHEVRREDVEVLDGAAALSSPDKLDQTEALEAAHVVGDVAQRLAQALGEVVRRRFGGGQLAEDGDLRRMHRRARDALPVEPGVGVLD